MTLRRPSGAALLLVLAVLWLLLCEFAAGADGRNVLVLYSNNRLVPGNVAVDHGLRAALSSPLDQPVEIFSEFLDRPEFSGEAYERTVTTYLQGKYAERPPAAIVAVSDEALDFVVRNRTRLFPGVPVVHAAVSPALLQSLPALPSDVVGVPVEYDYAGTIVQALRWHPQARRLVVVTGASARDREREARLRRDVPRLTGEISVEYLAGLPTSSLLQKLSALGADDVVFTPGYFQDGDGRLFNPRDTAALMAMAATAPMYGPLDTFIGTGVVGGRVPSFDDMGRQSARIVNELLAGATPSLLGLPSLTPTALRVDWRQVRRWNIDERLIPADAVVSYREPTFWEAYRNVALIAIAVMLLQAALIAKLLFERRRRRSAELAVQKQRTELAHASRLGVAGELTASIAHEINQPLGAVQSSADAADLILRAGGDRREDLLRIVERIRRDNRRASDVIRRLRALLAKHEPERERFDLNAAAADVMTLLRPEGRRRGVHVDFRPAMVETPVLGDYTQIQQVLINLMLNAMDAVVDVPDARRVVVLAVDRRLDAAILSVSDRGHGIPTAVMPKLFESFFSTKDTGMGLGLGIARTIVEAHGGRIWAEHGADGEGAVLRVELPISNAAELASASVA